MSLSALPLYGKTLPVIFADGYLEAVKNVIVYRITAPNATQKDYRD
jgi:hypothetical protein